MLNPPHRLRVLVFNWHEPYICLFAHTGHTIGVAPPRQESGKRWNHAFRPLPENVYELSFEEAQAQAARSEWDLVLCLTLQDVETVLGWQLPRLFVMLNMIGTDAGLKGRAKQEYVEGLAPIFEDIDISFISEKKRRDWGRDAPVVVSGIDPQDYGGYEGATAKVLRVGNMLVERDHMQGFSIQEDILSGSVPSSIVGVNPGVPASRPSRDWDDLKAKYRSHRLFLNTLTDEHEDGYNLASLEAMATGMPVVSTANSSSPIVDGQNGFVSGNLDYLRDKITLLLNDRELAAELGQNARQTVIERFHIEACAAGWQEVFSACIDKWKRAHPLSVLPTADGRSEGDAVADAGADTGTGGAEDAADEPAEYGDGVPDYYKNARPEIVELIPTSARRILDVGCAAGEMGRAIKKQRGDGVEVVGIEIEPSAADVARQHLDAVIIGDIDEMVHLPYPEAYFDCITFGDVLEHLRDPAGVLRKVLRHLSSDGELVCSIPNVRHQSVMLNLMVNGRWQYQDEGLLDRTHIHFFTLAEIREMLEEVGLQVGKLTATQSPPVAQMEPFIQATVSLGGNGENLRQESRIIQYVLSAPFAGRAAQEGAPAREEGAVPEGAADQAPRVTIVMPVFNQASYTEQCLYALVENTDPDPNYEMVVVDNASTDWTRYLLHAFEGDVQVINNDGNMGFARACNQGAKGASGDYLLFLNNDTRPHSGWLKAMVDLADQDEKVGVVGARLLYPESGKIQHAGLGLDNGVPDHLYRGVDADDPRVSQVRDVDMVTGACMLIRRELFERLGGFDPGYHNGVEDVDLCLQARDCGYRVVYCPDSVVDHYEGTSEGRFEHVRENLQRFAARWGDRFGPDGRFAVKPASVAPSTGTEKALSGYWEGSFFVHTSLALVNRELVRALLRRGRVDLGLIPYERHEYGAEADPHRLGTIDERLGRRLDGPADFHLRHRWPPDFASPPEGALILIQPWEVSRIPRSWIAPLQGVDQVWVPSSYTRGCYLDSGVEPEKVIVVPNGIDPDRFHPGLQGTELATNHGYVFLFVGGTLHRKGIDLLLKAYRNAFAPKEDVCLVIKDVGAQTYYRGQNAAESIRSAIADPTCAEILYLDEDLPDAAIPGLYAACDCLVHPYRGEGFGLPVLEAMACGVPVIVTAGGACDDFCDEDNAYLVPAQQQRVLYHEATVGQAWYLEPDIDELMRQMRTVFENAEEARVKGENAAVDVATEFTWDAAAARAETALQDLLSAAPAAATTESPKLEAANVVTGSSPGQKIVGESAVSDRITVDVAVVAVDEFLATHRDQLQPVIGDKFPRQVIAADGDGSFGGELEEFRRKHPASMYLFVGGEIEDLGTITKSLVAHLGSHKDVGMITPCLLPQEQGSGIVDVEFPSPLITLIRGEALAAIDGFEPIFRSIAALDEAARASRHRGWRVVCARDCFLDHGGRPSGDELLARREREAVRSLEEGDRLRTQGELDGALAAYLRAIDAKDNFVEVIMVASALMLERGRAAEAADLVQRLVDLDATSVNAHNYLGLAQYQAHRLDEARASFSRSLELDPQHVETLVNLSVLEWEQGEADAAVDYIERAAAAEPTNREVIVNTGLMHAQLGDAKSALALLRAFSERNQEDVDVQMILADLELQNGNNEQALLTAQQVLRLQPGHPGATSIAERLGGKEEE